MQYTPLITKNTKLPNGWTYTNHAAKKDQLELKSNRLYTITKTQKNRIPFYRVSVPVKKPDYLGDMKTVMNALLLTEKEAKALFPQLSNDKAFNNIIQGSYQLNELYGKQNKRLKAFCQSLQDKYAIEATVEETQTNTITLYTTTGDQESFCLDNYLTDKDFYTDLESWLNA